MSTKVTIFRRITAWQKEVYELEGNKTDAFIKAKRIALNPDSEDTTKSFLSSELMYDTVRSQIDETDAHDISYEIAIDGEMMEGGGNFGTHSLRRLVDKYAK